MESTLSKYQPQMLSIMRIMFGLLFLSDCLSSLSSRVFSMAMTACAAKFLTLCVPNSAGTVCQISCAVTRVLRDLTLRKPEPRRKSVPEGATYLVVRRRQATAPVGQPYARGLADADGHRESCRRVERSGRHGADYRDELEEFAEAVSNDPPGERATA